MAAHPRIVLDFCKLTSTASVVRPGDSYWSTPRALELVADRYPGIDLSEYEAAAAGGEGAEGGYGRLAKI